MKHILTKSLIGLSIYHSSAFAEKLIAPLFPEKGTWKVLAEQPLQDQSQNTVGKMLMYSLTPKDANSSSGDLAIIYEMNRSQNTSPVDYANNHARAIQMQCESSQITRPSYTLEKSIPVSYARAFCTKEKGGSGGFVQSIKILQGKEKFFMIIRQWAAPAFTFDPTVQNRMQFAKSIFKTESAATEWMAQADATLDHLENSVTLCSTKQGEFGAPCPSP